MALCTNHCDHGWIKLPFPVLLNGVVTDRIPCEVCDGDGRLGCGDGAVGGPRDVTNAPAPGGNDG